MARPERMPRTALRVAAAALAAQALVLGVWLFVAPGPRYPVVALFDERVTALAELRIVPALLVLVAGGGVALAIAGRGRCCWRAGRRGRASSW